MHSPQKPSGTMKSLSTMVLSVLLHSSNTDDRAWMKHTRAPLPLTPACSPQKWERMCVMQHLTAACGQSPLSSCMKWEALTSRLFSIFLLSLPDFLHILLSPAGCRSFLLFRVDCLSPLPVYLLTNICFFLQILLHEGKEAKRNLRLTSEASGYQVKTSQHPFISIQF